MDADLDLLSIAVYCTVDDLLPVKSANARRAITDQEVITLCIRGRGGHGRPPVGAAAGARAH